MGIIHPVTSQYGHYKMASKSEWLRDKTFDSNTSRAVSFHGLDTVYVLRWNQH